MATLKNLRIKSGWTQSQLAEYIHSSQVMICNYENRIALPDIEVMIGLENTFGERIDWRDDHSPKEKQELVKSLIKLAENYPLPSVVEFAARMYRREKVADNLINYYAHISGSDLEPMIPTNE